jgi:hypothetical protein
VENLVISPKKQERLHHGKLDISHQRFEGFGGRRLLEIHRYVGNRRDHSQRRGDEQAHRFQEKQGIINMPKSTATCEESPKPFSHSRGAFSFRQIAFLLSLLTIYAKCCIMNR